MSRELKVDRVANGFVGKIRFVHQQNNQFVAGDSTQGEIHVGIAFPDGIQTAQPNSFAFLFNRDRTVAENGKAVSIESLDNPVGVRSYIVISQNRYNHESRAQL